MNFNKKFRLETSQIFTLVLVLLTLLSPSAFATQCQVGNNLICRDVHVPKKQFDIITDVNLRKNDGQLVVNTRWSNGNRTSGHSAKIRLSFRDSNGSEIGWVTANYVLDATYFGKTKIENHHFEKRIKTTSATNVRDIKISVHKGSSHVDSQGYRFGGLIF